jgi:hypothetical protein
VRKIASYLTNNIVLNGQKAIEETMKLQFGFYAKIVCRKKKTAF